MSHKQIQIRVKEEGNKSVRTTIDVDYGDTVAKYKMEELGNLISSLNPDAVVEVSFMVHNTISNTWMEMFSYYANEKRHVTFS